MPELTPKEQYEARRVAEKGDRAAAPATVSSPASRGRFLWWGMALLIILGVGYTLYSAVRAEIPKTKDQSKPYDIVSREHIAVDSARPATYNSNPPTSGPHYQGPAAVGFYDKTLPDEQLIHNLEHGDVWVSYQGTLSSTTIEALKGLLDGAKVTITE